MRLDKFLKESRLIKEEPWQRRPVTGQDTAKRQNGKGGLEVKPGMFWNLPLVKKGSGFGCWS